MIFKQTSSFVKSATSAFNPVVVSQQQFKTERAPSSAYSDDSFSTELGISSNQSSTSNPLNPISNHPRVVAMIPSSLSHAHG